MFVRLRAVELLQDYFIANGVGSMVKLAEKLGVRPNQLSRWKSMRTLPNFQRAKRIIFELETPKIVI